MPSRPAAAPDLRDPSLVEARAAAGETAITIYVDLLRQDYPDASGACWRERPAVVPAVLRVPRARSG